VIIYDLQCENDHKFEGWFKDREAFERQKDEKLINCPVCASSNITMLPSSLSIVGKKACESTEKKAKSIPAHAMFRMLNEYLEKSFEDVGDQFADSAVKIHRGEAPKRNIRGTTTKEQEEALSDEGVPYIKIPVIKFDS